MLTKIVLEYFKCFQKLHLPLAPLTLLSGINGSGKSSIIQSLALLNQTITECATTKMLIINGSNVSLGSAADVIDNISGRKEFTIGVVSDNFECCWKMEVQDRTALCVPIKEVIWGGKDKSDIIEIRIEGENDLIENLIPLKLKVSDQALNLSSTLANLTYISANRLGPRETYSVSTPDQRRTVGPRGEYAAWFLYYFADTKPLGRLICRDAPPTLQRQTEAWMNKFFPGTSFNIEPVKGANLITLGIKMNSAADFCRPANVGYGLTHVLPIITACLGAGLGDIILVENPEAHLHPSCQSAVGYFLAQCASAGIQIIVETHSDHVLNGLRRAIKDHNINPDKGISYENVAIHFFKPRSIAESQGSSQVLSPEIYPDGNLSDWPIDFFDQFDKDNAYLIEWD